VRLRGSNGDEDDEPYFYEDVQARRAIVRERRAVLLATLGLLLAIAMTRL